MGGEWHFIIADNFHYCPLWLWFSHPSWATSWSRAVRWVISVLNKWVYYKDETEACVRNQLLRELLCSVALKASMGLHHTQPLFTPESPKCEQPRKKVSLNNLSNCSFLYRPVSIYYLPASEPGSDIHNAFHMKECGLSTQRGCLWLLLKTWTRLYILAMAW